MKYKIIGGIIAAVFLLGIIGSVIVMTAKPKNTVRIVSDGRTLYTIDLSTAEDETFTVGYGGISSRSRTVRSASRMRTAPIKPVSRWGG